MFVFEIFLIIFWSCGQGRKNKKRKNRPVLSPYTNRTTQEHNNNQRTNKEQPKSLQPRNRSDGRRGKTKEKKAYRVIFLYIRKTLYTETHYYIVSTTPNTPHTNTHHTHNHNNT